MVFPRSKNLIKNKQNVLHGQLCQLTEQLWIFQGFSAEIANCQQKKFTINARTLMISTSSKSSNIRLLQWRTEVFGHKGQLYKALLHHIAFLILVEFFFLTYIRKFRMYGSFFFLFLKRGILPFTVIIPQMGNCAKPILKRSLQYENSHGHQEL